jgi:hypothetical protein
VSPCDILYLLCASKIVVCGIDLNPQLGLDILSKINDTFITLLHVLVFLFVAGTGLGLGLVFSLLLFKSKS